MPADEPLTDKQIVEMATEEWVRVLARMWEAIDKPIDADRLQVYRRELGTIPLGLLEKAVSRCIRENTWLTVPPVGKIWEALRKELGNPYDVNQAIAEWEDAGWRRCTWYFNQPVSVETEEQHD